MEIVCWMGAAGVRPPLMEVWWEVLRDGWPWAGTTLVDQTFSVRKRKLVRAVDGRKEFVNIDLLDVGP